MSRNCHAGELPSTLISSVTETIMHRPLAVLAGTALVGVVAFSAQAQTIYPLDKAEILAGARFDLKVEFPGAPPQSGVRVTINGADATAVLQKPATFVEREDGATHSAYWIRGAALPKP